MARRAAPRTSARVLILLPFKSNISTASMLARMRIADLFWIEGEVFEAMWPSPFWNDHLVKNLPSSQIPEFVCYLGRRHRPCCSWYRRLRKYGH